MIELLSLRVGFEEDCDPGRLVLENLDKFQGDYWLPTREAVPELGSSDVMLILRGGAWGLPPDPRQRGAGEEVRNALPPWHGESVHEIRSDYQIRFAVWRW